MSRAGYCDEDEDGTAALWRNAVKRAIQGARGQAFLRDFIATLDAMPVQELAAHSFQNERGEVCSLGSVCVARGISMDGFMDKWGDMAEADKIGDALNISPAMAREIMWNNDENGPWDRDETPAQRWVRMRNWAVKRLTTTETP